jgi:hypothetical protein
MNILVTGAYPYYWTKLPAEAVMLEDVVPWTIVRATQFPLKASRQVAAGSLLCPDRKNGTDTFEQYLARRYPAH